MYTKPCIYEIGSIIELTGSAGYVGLSDKCSYNPNLCQHPGWPGE